MGEGRGTQEDEDADEEASGAQVERRKRQSRMFGRKKIVAAVDDSACDLNCPP